MGKGRAEGKDANDTKANAAGGVQYQFAIKPVVKPGWEGIKDFIWNTETSEFLGRTAISWFKITVFYIIYYGFLAGFFMAMLMVFYQTLDDKHPKWQNDNGIIGGNPGVGYRPKPADAHVESTLITFRHNENRSMGTWGGWVDRLSKFLEAYEKKDNKNKRGATETESKAVPVECTFDMAPKGPPEGQICKVMANTFLVKDCTKDNNYGFPAGKPCILLKLNKIYGWLPKPFENSSLLPDNAPTALRTAAAEFEKDTPNGKGKMVWLSCEGENPADVENVGKIEYYPYPGIPDYHFPYENQDQYTSPVVFAHFTAPKHGVLIAVECKAWAKNIKHDETKMERIGSVHFEILID